MKESHDNFSEFQAWLQGLTWQQMQTAMEFACDDDSLESVLLHDMVRLQAPPPTPIHPRADVGYQKYLNHEVSDGRNQVERIRRDRWRRPRLFQWIRRTSHGCSSKKKNVSKHHQPPMMFDVVARQFRSPDGEQWSLGCTDEQRRVDQELVQGTVLVHLPPAAATTAALSSSRRVIRYRLVSGSSEDAIQDPKQLVLHLLHVASRGHLFSQRDNAFNNNGSSPPFTAAWLNPTRRWFSLSMYLASRFEVALWASFRQQRKNGEILSLKETCCWRGDDLLLSDERKGLTILGRAAGKAMNDILRQDKDDSNWDSPRQSRLWYLLENKSMFGATPFRLCRDEDLPSIQRMLEGLRTCHLTDVGLPNDQFRNQTCQHLQDEIALETERALLNELDVEQKECNNIKKNGRSKGKKKNKRKKTKKQEKSVLKAISIKDAEKDEKQLSSDEDMEENRRVDGEGVSDPPISFPTNKRSARDRSRNIVLALSILDDVIECVFVDVGLGEEPTDDHAKASPDPALLHPKEEEDLAEPTEPLMESLKSGSERIVADANDEAKLLPYHDDHFLLSQQRANIAGESDSVADHMGQFLTPVASFDAFPSHYATFGGGFFHRSEPDGFTWEICDDALDDWGRIHRYANREHSLLAEHFHSLERVTPERTDLLVASSTAASIDSSSDKAASEPEIVDCEATDSDGGEDIKPNLSGKCSKALSPEIIPCEPKLCGDRLSMIDSRSPSPQAPSTPSPTLSPILVSLADLKDLQSSSLQSVLQNSCHDDHPKLPSARSLSSVTAASLPGSPYQPRLVSSRSREDLRITKTAGVPKMSPQSSHALPCRAAGTRLTKSRDDHDLQRKISPRKSTDVLSSYRNTLTKHTKSKDDNDIKQTKPALRSSDPPTRRFVAARYSGRSAPTAGASISEASHIHFDLSPAGKGNRNQDLCVRSETALDGNDDSQHWHDSRPTHGIEEGDNNTVTKDGSTTITSALSQREAEEISALKEERNTFRDMCLTLGAEVAKLKNMLAAQKGAAGHPFHVYSHGFPEHVYGAPSFDPDAIAPMVPRARTLAAMSDAGYRGDHESLASEEDAGGRLSKATVAGSDVSVDHTSGHHVIHLPTGVPMSHDFHGPVSLNGMQSRLAADIVKFLDATNLQLRKQEIKRRTAVERITRLVNTMWPRAQVKLYGSHVTGLCLPSSDLDFVVCLPAVHKKDLAVAPGVLEGRNAINESSQKVLARKLKGESWIDPRTIKLIERTAVPVIKVATKDTKARTLQLDITFDGPGHHGLEAIHMVSQIMEELPMLRPLVLVLKQFLLDRGLLTAYTGGLSSYCLFLMVARYLQEQSSWCDGGSLLMGFLDFYGNHFNPRSTGISVRRREYFPRPNYASEQNRTASQPTAMMWKPPPYLGPGQTPATASAGFFRRNSFNDKGSVDVVRGGPPIMATRPPRFQASTSLTHQQYLPADTQTEQSSFDHRVPNTFDPLWVEDPLSEGNNVGRNAFRFLQVQRAFSDAHRALVAALEWDMQSAGDSQDDPEYPLLKSLLQSEDVVFEL